MSKHLNPRVGSMVVLSLISNALLLKEAAAEKNPATFFSKGFFIRIDVGQSGIKPDLVKPITGLLT